MADNESPAQAVEAQNELTPGVVLKQTRDTLGKSLSDMSKELHLDRWMLEAIERDDFASLGAPVFAKGHLRQYAKALGIEPDDLMVGYYQVCGSREQPPLLADSMLRTESHSERNFTWVIPLLVALFAIATIGGAIYWYLQPTEEPASIGGESPRELTLDAEPLREASLSLQAPAVEPPQEKPEPTVVEEIDEASSNLLIPAAEAPEIIEVDASSEGGESRFVSDNITVTLRFSGESWVEVYDAKRQKLLYGLVESASAKYLSGPPPISIFLGHQNAVNVEVNGASYSIPPDALRGNTARFQIEKPN